MMCDFVKRDGERCNAQALKGSKKCFFHSEDEQTTAKRRDAQKRGGLNGKISNKTLDLGELDSLDDLTKANTEVIRAIARNELPCNRGNSLGYLLNIQLKVLEMRDIIPTLDKLEKALKAGKHTT